MMSQAVSAAAASAGCVPVSTGRGRGGAQGCSAAIQGAGRTLTVPEAAAAQSGAHSIPRDPVVNRELTWHC